MKKLILILLLALFPNFASANTLVIYPDAGPAETTISGMLSRATANETFATIRAGVGTNAYTSSSYYFAGLESDSGSDEFKKLHRSIFTFDTSSLIGETVFSAEMSLYSAGKENAFGSTPDIDIVSSTPASDNVLIAADYSQLGTTSFGSIAYGDFSTSGYANISLNASGKTAINTSGITELGIRTSWDTDNNFDGTWGATQSMYVSGYFAQQTGTTNDPKLTIEYNIQIIPAQQSIIYY